MHLFHSEISCSEAGLLQKASPLSKAILLVITILFISTRKDASGVWPVAAMLLSLVTLSGVRFYKIALLLVLPLATALMFAAYTMHNQELVVARSTVGVLAAIMFFFTTEIYDSMAMLSPLLPAELADGIYLTYRSVFLMGSRVSEALRGLQLRGLYSPTAVFSNVGLLAGVLGNVLCDSLDSAERMGKIMTLRGVSGSIAPRGFKATWSRWDLVPLVACAVVLLLAVGGVV